MIILRMWHLHHNRINDEKQDDEGEEIESVELMTNPAVYQMLSKILRPSFNCGIFRNVFSMLQSK